MKIKTKDIALIAIFVAVIIVCTFIRVPIGTIPVTLQTFAVMAAAGILGAKRSAIAVFVYLVLGMIGIPVFSSGGGIGAIAGPTGGFLVGFIPAALIAGGLISFSIEKLGKFNPAIAFGAMVLADAVCFALGVLWFVVSLKSNLATALTSCVVPFIIPDLVKIAAAVLVSMSVRKYVKVID